jgi:polyisoprenoid-binding protein YceI
MRNGITAAAALLAASAFAVTATAEVHQFQVDTVHSNVGFKVRHLAGKTPGQFNEFSGSVWLDPEKPGQTLKLEGVIQAASIDTDNDKRDNHLRSADFFDVENFPEIEVVSKSVKKDGDGLIVLADVTMRGVTKEVKFAADLGGVMTNPFTGTPTTGVELTGKLDRKDFGIVWNKALDAGGFLLGDDVQIVVQLEATVPKAETKES